LYASPTTVNGAFTPSSRRVVARATWAIVWWRCAWPDALRRAASMASASTAGAGAGRVEARAPVHMSFAPSGASGAARRATKFVRSANEAAGVARDNSVSVTRAVTRRGLENRVDTALPKATYASSLQTTSSASQLGDTHIESCASSSASPADPRTERVSHTNLAALPERPARPARDAAPSESIFRAETLQRY